ncbi:tetratricopeptide repeat protein [Brachyspira pulli]|uniref:tetratricopeptide repeat protein n=1 Tax=Brachyspira pulli TaxID=310721 RepID=UPI003006CF94
MDFNLPMPYDKDLTEEEKTAIDEYVDKTYEEFKDNGKQLTRLAAQASSAISAGKAKAEKLANQGFFKNLVGNITGKNRKLRGEIDRDFAVSQQACIKMIQKLAQQGKLTFDAIMGVNCKLNCLVTQIDKEFNEVYSQMQKMMTMSMSALIRESTRIDKLERSMNVVHLESTIEYLDFDGVLYKDLENNNEKMLCIISDFFLATKGNYSLNDLMMLKPMMDKIGINPSDKISMISLYNTLLSNSKIADKFFEALDKAKLNELEDIEVPLLGNIKKIEKLETDEKYIVDSIVDMSGKDEKEVQFNLLKNYAASNLNMDLEKENSYFDLSVAMINELKDIDLVEIEEKKETPKISASANLIFDLAIELLEKEGDFEGSLYLLEKAKTQGLDTAELYQKMGEALLNLSKYEEANKYEEAAVNFDLSVKKGLDNYYNNYNIAMSYVYARDPQKAKEPMIKAVKLDPNSYDANINLGVIYRVFKEYSKAVEYYDKAIKINNEIPLAFMNKAEALDKSGGNRFLIEEALNRAMALDQSLVDELKTKSGNFYKDLSSKLKYSFYKTIDQNEEYDEDNDNEGENYVLEMNNNRIIGDIDFIAFTLEDK